jgi:hypothetical protein
MMVDCDGGVKVNTSPPEESAARVASHEVTFMILTGFGWYSLTSAGNVCGGKL